ncbi:MAG TPA: LysR family transcriptional regulator [Roseiarcus sp.]|jgi:DNA-binding transcriptional LysR family regulator|nr:LysR family transcriptional regulator [Roseiarcus sp.]
MHSVRQFEFVKALATHRHFGRAAAALGVSQPALTRSLKHLEDILGVPLFDRQGVTPTVFGELMLNHGEPVIKGFADLLREIDLAKGLEIGEFSVSAGPYPADISGQRAIGMLSAQHPRVAVEFKLFNWTKIINQVLNGRIDLGFAEIFEAVQNPELETEHVRTSQMYFFCAAGHPLAGRNSVMLEDLCEFPWVGPTVPGRMRQFLPQGDLPCGVFDAVKNRFSPRIMVGTFGATKHIVLAGQGLSVAPPFQLAREIDDGECVLLPLELPWMSLNYGFISKRGRTHSPAAKAFMDNVRQIEKGLPP